MGAPDAIPVPAGRLAFFVDPACHNQIRYGLVASHNRYADGVTIYEFPRGAPDAVYVNHSLDRGDRHRTLVVEWGKEKAALERLGITLEPDEDATQALLRAGYVLESRETLPAAAAREGWEEHGYSLLAYPDKLLRLIALRGHLPFADLYRPGEQYEQYVELAHITDADGIALAKNEGKREKRIPGRVGASYSEEGTWVTLAEIAQQAEQIPAGAAHDYAQSVVNNLRDVELTLLGVLRGGTRNGRAEVIRGGQIRVHSSVVDGAGIAEIGEANSRLRPEVLMDFPEQIAQLARRSRFELRL